MSLQVWLPLSGDIKNYGRAAINFNILDLFRTHSDVSNKLNLCYRNISSTAGGLVSDRTINLGQQQSMFCWFKFSSLISDSSLGGSMVGQHRYPNNTGLGITIKYVSSTTGYLSVNTGNGSSRTFNTYCGTTLLQANTWYHGGFTYNNGVLKIYVNGVCEYTGNIGIQSVPADYIQLFCWSFGSASGSDIYANYKLNGWLNDVRIYNNVLSDQEVKILSGAVDADKGLQVWLPLTYDSSTIYGVKNNVAASSSNISIVNNGKVGKCASFNGSNSSISGNWPSYSTEVTFALWVKFNSLSAGTHLLDCRNPSGEAGYQPMYVTSTYIQVGNSGTSFPNVSYNFSTGVWYHIAVVYNSSDTKTYINGSLINTTTDSKGYNFNTNLPFYIGCRCSGANRLNGCVNDFRIYNKALTADQIKNLSRGLCLHYLLNHDSQGKDNLVLNATKGWSSTGYNVMQEFMSEGWIQGQQYTITIKGWPSPGNYFGLWRDNGNVCAVYQISNKVAGYDDIWTATFTCPAASASGIPLNQFSIYDVPSSGVFNSRIDWIKIEKTSKYTSPSLATFADSHFDRIFYTEPDGSKWLHVVHHNNPASNLFSSSNTFDSNVFIDANRWYYLETIAKQAPSYEFLVKQKTTSSDTEVKYRWIQKANPTTAVWNEVTPSAVKRITTSGYTDAGSQYGGGLYILNSNTRMCIANTSNGNWWGATGCYTAFSGGIPGAGGQTVTTGYMDIYIRVDDMFCIEHDASGMGNHGLKYSTMKYNINTSKYTLSTNFNGNDEVIQTPNLATITDGNFTFSVWFYKDSWGSKSWETIFGGPSGFELEGKLSTSTNAYIHPYSWGGGSTSSPNSYSIPYTFNQWHMITMTRTSSETKFYLDGVLKVTGTTGTIPSGNYFIGAWRDSVSQNFQGYMSDARLYGTALSADDVAKLYNRDF